MASCELDNVFWRAFTGSQAALATGHGAARRFRRGYSPILAFENPAAPDFAPLDAYCEPGEQFYTDTSGPAPAGWRVLLESTMLRLAYDGPPAAAPTLAGMRALGPADRESALALAALTSPGPFGPLTPTLGLFLGVFEDGRLVAMAGERVWAAPWREISAVCTHPQWRGRGLALGLTGHLLRAQAQRAERSFLHVMNGNLAARALYEGMGFRCHREVPVRVVERL